MSSSLASPLFPLYLAPFEQFMIADDRSRHPMMFVIQLRLSGAMDQAAFETALAGALNRHPFLHALVQRRKKNRLCWVSAGDLPTWLDWRDGDAPLSCPAGREAIDLTAEVGLRIWVRRQPQETRITAQFHHACCDGVGAYRFLGDLLAIYGQLTASDDAARPELEPVEVSRLRTRCRGAFDLAAGDNRRALAWRALTEGLSVMTACATPLAPGRNGYGQRLSPFPSIQSYTFARAEHEQLRQAAMQHGALLNDLLLAELLHTARAWNERKTGRRGGKFRIMMPTDLRTTDDYHLPAANKVSFTFITRRSTDLDRPEELLRSVRRETVAIKNERRGLRFADMLACGFSLKGVVPLMLSVPFCLATAILSNVGDPSRRFTARFPRRGGRVVCGDVVLEEITGAPPQRYKTQATLSAFAYNRQLTLSLRCDPFSFAPEDTQEFLNLYAAQLGRHLTTTAPAAIERELTTV